MLRSYNQSHLAITVHNLPGNEKGIRQVGSGGFASPERHDWATQPGALDRQCAFIVSLKTASYSYHLICSAV